jgi:glyoxalase family protein
MENRILGLHHITAIAGNAQRNYDFYTGVLGLRLVKKTVNFDDPGTYHFYYGDEVGSPGTILTFFPWEGIRAGHTGTGMATTIAFSIPDGSLAYWTNRLEKSGVTKKNSGESFGESFISFQDPDGLNLKLVIPASPDNRKAWDKAGVDPGKAIKGFHAVELTLKNSKATGAVLTDILGYRLQKQEDNKIRFITDAIEHAQLVDIIESPNERPGLNAGGTNHHVAFRVKDEETLMAYREKVVAKGLAITEKIDRNYFYSLYFREPGGVLFEIATDNPGFAIDEGVQELGNNLKLPQQYEESRKEIEKILPVLQYS